MLRGHAGADVATAAINESGPRRRERTTWSAQLGPCAVPGDGAGGRIGVCRRRDGTEPNTDSQVSFQMHVDQVANCLSSESDTLLSQVRFYPEIVPRVLITQMEVFGKSIGLLIFPPNKIEVT